MRQNKLKLKKENNPDGKKPSLGVDTNRMGARNRMGRPDLDHLLIKPPASTLTLVNSRSVPVATLRHLFNLGEKLGVRSRVTHPI